MKRSPGASTRGHRLRCAGAAGPIQRGHSHAAAEPEDPPRGIRRGRRHHVGSQPEADGRSAGPRHGFWRRGCPCSRCWRRCAGRRRRRLPPGPAPRTPGAVRALLRVRRGFGGDSPGAGTPGGPPPRVRQKIRLLVTKKGRITLENEPLPAADAAPLHVAVAPGPVDSSNPFLYHKTTNRSLYEAARAACPGYDDVLLLNERGEVTESTIANVAVEIEGTLYTPPVRCGLLPGTLRADLLERGDALRALHYSRATAAKSARIPPQFRAWHVSGPGRRNAGKENQPSGTPGFTASSS